MLRKLETRAAQRSLGNLRTRLCAVGQGELRERDAFDRAFLTTVLGEIPNRERALKEIYDALKPGGMLSVTEVLIDPHYQSRATVQRLVMRAGFRLERAWGNVFNFTMNFVKPDGD